MEKSFKLPPRLAAIAEAVPEGARLADVGTDHGLLPIRLLLDGKIPCATATDIRPGPLSRAMENAEYAGVQNMRCILCDGLSGVSPDAADTVVIAGMGGENIAGILRSAPWACRSARLILQPMSRPEELRSALPSLGLRILSEHLVRDAGRLYCILVVGAGEAEPLSPGELYCGKYSHIASDALFGEWLSEQEKHLTTAVRGLEMSARPEDQIRRTQLQTAAEDIAAARRKYYGNRT